VSRSRSAAGGGRWVDVDPERLAGWVDGFRRRHGDIETSSTPEVVTLRATDAAVAELQVPFPPLPVSSSDGPDLIARFVAHAAHDRLVGVLLVRRGGYAAGVFHGSRLVASKVGSRHVQGRSAAGGWSQQRFARRRAGQGKVAMSAAADVAAALLLPYAGRLEGLVLGGDRASVGKFSLMPAAKAGGIDAERIAKACLIRDMAEYSLGKWRAADIAHANKEDADTFHLRTWRRMEGAWHEKGKAGKTGDQPIAWRAQGLDAR